MKKMSKNMQILIISAAGIIILAAVVLLLLLTQPKENDEADGGNATSSADEEADSSLVFSSQSAEDIKSITVANRSDAYTITSEMKSVTNSDGTTTEEQVWSVVDIGGDCDLNQAAFTTIANYSAEIKAKQLVEENCAELEKYGLADPVAEVNVTYADDTSVSFLIGNPVPTDTTSTYFAVKGGNDVYIYATTKLNCYANTRYYYVKTQLMPEYDSENAPMIEKITVVRSDLEEPIVIEAIPEDSENSEYIAYSSHRFTSPYNVYVDQTNHSDLIYGFFGLTASEAAWVGMEDKDYEVAGLNDPTAVITMLYLNKEYTITLGAPLVSKTENSDGTVTTTLAGYYGTFSEDPDVLYEFTAGSVPWATMDVEDCMARLFLLPYIYSLDGIVYKDSERTIEFDVKKTAAAGEDEKDTYEFYMDGERIEDEDKFKELYQYFISAYGEEIYTDEEKGGFICSLTYKYSDPNRADDTVSFYNSDTDRKTIIAVNGENLFKTRQMFSTRLVENMENYLNGGEISLNY